jgi:hypothetical protein
LTFVQCRDSDLSVEGDQAIAARRSDALTGSSKMTLDDFRQSLTAAQPPAGLTLALAGLWWDAKGDSTRAHESARTDEGPGDRGCMRITTAKEGDQGNAASGMVGRASPIVGNCWMRNGSTS